MLFQMSLEFRRGGVLRMSMVDYLHPEGARESVANDVPKVKLVLSGRKKRLIEEVTGSILEMRAGEFPRGGILMVACIG